MNNNNLQIKNKTSYDKSNNLWIQDPFLRKEKAIELPSYSEKVVYDHGLSTHLFDRNQGIYAYQKKGIVNTKQKKIVYIFLKKIIHENF
jgi:hypothetical protein